MIMNHPFTLTCGTESNTARKKQQEAKPKATDLDTRRGAPRRCACPGAPRARHRQSRRRRHRSRRRRRRPRRLRSRSRLRPAAARMWVPRCTPRAPAAPCSAPRTQTPSTLGTQVCPSSSSPLSLTLNRGSVWRCPCGVRSCSFPWVPEPPWPGVPRARAPPPSQGWRQPAREAFPD